MKLRLVLGLTALALLLGGMVTLPRLAAEDPPKKTPIDFTLKSTDDKTIKLSDYRGKVVLVDIWATWCPPCRREIPEIIDLQSEATKDKLDLTILGISIDQNKGGVPDFVKNNKMNYPVLFAEQKALQALGEIQYVPTKFIIDKFGVVRDKLVGGMTKADLKKKLEPYLKEKGPEKKDAAKKDA